MKQIYAKRPLKVAIFGASGAVGRQVLLQLQESSLGIVKWYVFASESAKGRYVSLSDGTSLPLQFADMDNLPEIDLAFVATPQNKAGAIVRALRATKTLTIDLTQSFSLEPKVPLVVADVQSIAHDAHFVASPLPLVVAMNHILSQWHANNTLSSVQVVSLMGVSHHGRAGMSELMNQTKDSLMNKPSPIEVFHKSIAFNIIPQCGSITKSGLTTDEDLWIGQMRKTIGAIADMQAQFAWVPLFHGCGSFVTIVCERPIAKAELIAGWKDNPNIIYDASLHEIGPMVTPMDVQGEDQLVISRLYIDPKNQHKASFWMTFDNLRLGSSVNAVKLAEALVGNVR